MTEYYDTHTSLNDENPWLVKKCQEYVGHPTFSPKSYLELGEFWGELNYDQVLKGEDYGKLRLLVQKSQGRSVIWTHRYGQSLRSAGILSEEQQIFVEKEWRRIVACMTNQEIALLDFLILEPIHYQIDRGCLVTMIRDGGKILEKIIVRGSVHLFV